MILIDGIFVSHPQPGGYRTYTANLVQHLRSLASSHHYELLIDREMAWEPAPNWRVEVIPRQGHWGFVWREQVKLPRLAAQKRASLLHCPGATGPVLGSTPIVVTVYDTIELSEPLPSLLKLKRWSMRAYSRYVQQAVARRAAAIITISEHSKRQIVKRFGVSPSLVTAIHLAPSDFFQVMDKNLARKQASSRFGVSGYVLAIASIAPRKNIGTLVRAYAMMDKPIRAKHPLVLVCTHASARKALEELTTSLGIEGAVAFAEHVPDTELSLLYNSATLFVFPSLEEGFGLPPLEAMACGTPVIASNTSSMPEVLSNAALLVPPTDVQTLSETMAAVLTNPSLADDLRERGLARSREFSWKRTARETLKVYESVGT